MLLSMRNPRNETGRASSHAPDSFFEAAKRRERDIASGVFFSRVSTVTETWGNPMHSDGRKQDQT